MTQPIDRLLVFTDGGARGNPGPAGIGVFIIDSAGKKLAQISKFIGTATNNEAEYLALIESVRWVKDHSPSLSVGQISWFLDSQLVVQQIQKNWKIKEPRLLELAETAWGLLAKIDLPYSLIHVVRAKNKEADRLVNQAIDLELLS